jgi:TonB family protein
MPQVRGLLGASGLAWLAGAGLAIASGAGAQVIADAVKTDRDAAAFYPAKALADGVDGRALVRCLPSDAPSQPICQVGGEQPSNLGFGPAALAFVMANLGAERLVANAPRPTLIGVSFQARPARVVPAAVATPSVAGPSVVTNSMWVEKPTAAQFGAYYPEKAARTGRGGRVVLHCLVTAAGSVENCSVASEDPPRQGFGRAALKLSAYFKMRPMTKDGVPVGGAQIDIPIRFSVGH